MYIHSNDAARKAGAENTARNPAADLGSDTLDWMVAGPPPPGNEPEETWTVTPEAFSDAVVAAAGKTLAEAARIYASAGVPIFPCHPLSKTPITEHGFKDASANPAVVAAWWKATPDANIGICPEHIGMLVVDTDPPDGNLVWSRECWSRGVEGPVPTLTVTTPRGGSHLWHEGSGPSGAKKLFGDGVPIDTRGVGGYVLAPPSRTSSEVDKKYGDGAYTLTADCLPIPVPIPVPDWLTALLSKPRDPLPAPGFFTGTASPIDVDRAIAHLRHTAPPAIEGHGGDQRTLTVAMDLHDLGIDQGQAIDLMEAHYNPRCVPPWDTDELATKVANGYRYAHNDFGCHAVDVVAHAWFMRRVAEYLRADTAKEEKERPKKPSRLCVVSPSQFMAMEPAKEMVKGILPAEGCALIYGQPGCYKSFGALGLAFSVATGRPAFGHHEVLTVRPTVYCVGENLRAMATVRFPGLLAQSRLSPEEVNFRLVHGVPFASTPADWKTLIDNIEASLTEAPGLIVVDTLARAMAGLNENDASDGGRFADMMLTVADHFNCMALGVAHEGKDASKGIRGSNAIQGAMDVIWHMVAVKDRLAAELKCEKDRDGEDGRRIHLIGEKVAVTGSRDGTLLFRASDEKEWNKQTGKAKGTITPADLREALENVGAVHGNAKPVPMVAQELARMAGAIDDVTIKGKAKRLNEALKAGMFSGYLAHLSAGNRDPSTLVIPDGVE